MPQHHQIGYHLLEPAHGRHPELKGRQRLTRVERGIDIDELTPRELEIAQLTADGLNGPETAKKMFLGNETIKHHWRVMRLKTRKHTRAGVVAKLLREGKIQ